LRPETVAIVSCVQPASATLLKQPSPSVTTRAPRVTICPVILLMFFFVNRRTRRSFTRWALPSPGGLESGDERRLTGAAPSALAAAALPAEIGIVHPDAAVERLALVALQHHLPELVMHRPGGAVADVEAARGPACFASCGTWCGTTPLDQAWCLGAAGVALPQCTLF